MSFWSRLFGGDKGYKDEALNAAVTKALMNDPLVNDPESIGVTCEDGVVTLTGRVDKAMAKDHIEGTVREALRFNGLKYEKLDNQVKVQPAQSIA